MNQILYCDDCLTLLKSEFTVNEYKKICLTCGKKMKLTIYDNLILKESKNIEYTYNFDRLKNDPLSKKTKEYCAKCKMDKWFRNIRLQKNLQLIKICMTCDYVKIGKN